MLLLISLESLCVTQKALQLPFHSSFLFSTPFLSARFFGPTAKSSLNELLPRKCENKIGSVSLDIRNKVCATNIFGDIIYDACDLFNAMCFILFTVTSIHNFGKYTKIRDSKKRWKVTQKMQGSKEKEIDLINRKTWRKMKKMLKRRNWLIHKLKVILPLFLKNLSRQKT